MTTTPMLAAAQHPKQRNVAQSHRTPTQVRRTNRRQEQREVAKLAAQYTSATR